MKQQVNGFNVLTHKQKEIDAGCITTGTIKADTIDGIEQDDIIKELKQEIEKLKASKLKVEEEFKTLQANAGNELGRLNITIDTLVARINRK